MHMNARLSLDDPNELLESGEACRTNLGQQNAE